MDQPPKTLLLKLSPVDIKPAFITALEDGYKTVKELTDGKSDEQFTKSLQSHLSKYPSDDRKLQLGLMCMGLLDHSSQRVVVFNLVVIARDKLGFFTNEMHRLANEHWLKLEQNCRVNFVALVAEMMQSGVSGTEIILMHLLKRMSTGDLRPLNIWLCHSNLDLIMDHRDWVEDPARPPNSPLIATIVYSFLRIIPDHHNVNTGNTEFQQQILNLKTRECNLVVSLIRKFFDRCIILGRDLARVLQDVSMLPEFHALWRDIIFNPTILSTKFAGLLHLLERPPDMNLNGTIIPPEMEMWILWMMRHIKTNIHPYKRYQEFFQRKFFSTPESQSLRVCLVRYIVTAFYPDNEMLSSTLITRWALITWIISQCTSPVAISNAKLALVYDWLFYTKSDCIMNVEPAILCIMHNIPKSVQTSYSMVEFLIKVSHLYHPPIATNIVKNIRHGLHEMLKLKVIPSLIPLYDCLQRDPELSRNLLDLFGEVGAPPLPVSSAAVVAAPPSSAAVSSGGLQRQLSSSSSSPSITSVSSPAATVSSTTANNNININTNSLRPSVTTRPPLSDDLRAPVMSIDSLGALPNSNILDTDSLDSSSNLVSPNATTNFNNHHQTIGQRRRSSSRCSNIPQAKFSDEDDDDDNDSESVYSDSKIDEIRRRFNDYRLHYLFDVKRQELGPLLAQIDEPVKSALERLKSALASEDGDHDEDPGEAVEGLVSAVLEDENFDDLEHASRTAAVVCELCHAQFEQNIFPDEPTPQDLEESISAPIFVLFRNVCQMSSTDTKRELLLLLLTEMHAKQPRLGYLLLYYLKVSKINDEHYMAYRNFCTSQDQPDLKQSLYQDLQLLTYDDRRMFVFLIPDIYTVFANEMVGDSRFLRLLVSSIDGLQVCNIVTEIMRGHLNMFSKETLKNVLVNSLDWETTEQYFFWQLLNAHEIPTEHFLPLLPRLVYKDHPEAASNLLIMFKLERPNEDLVRAVLSRPVLIGDLFTVSIIHFWGLQHTSKLADLIHTLITHKDKKKLKKDHQSPFVHSQSNEQSGPSLGQILGHLDAMRTQCRNLEFLQQETLQASLQWVQINGSEDLKLRFSELLAIAEDPVEQAAAMSKSSLTSHSAMTRDSKTGAQARNLRNLVSRKAAQAERRLSSSGNSGKRNNQELSSSEESDDEEEFIIPSKKRKKKVLRLDDDD